MNSCRDHGSGRLNRISIGPSDRSAARRRSRILSAAAPAAARSPAVAAPANRASIFRSLSRSCSSNVTVLASKWLERRLIGSTTAFVLATRSTRAGLVSTDLRCSSWWRRTMSPPVIADRLHGRCNKLDGEPLALGELVGLAFDEGFALLVVEECDDRSKEAAVLFGLQQGLPGASPE